MKNVILAVAILLIIAGISFSNAAFNKKFTKQISRQISEINHIVFLGNLKSVDTQLEKIDLYLEKHKTLLRATANHTDFMDFYESYARLKAYCKLQDFANYTVEYANIIRIIEHIYDSERMDMGNIF